MTRPSPGAGDTLRTLRLDDGASGAPTLVCLPGLMCPPELFVDAVRASGLRGVGVAWMEHDGPFGLDAIAARVLDAIADLGPVVLVGHSMGVPIAVLAALRDRERGTARVRGLVLANSGANTRGHGDIDAFVSRVERGWGPLLWDAFVKRCLGGPVPDALRARMLAYPRDVSPEAAIACLRSQQSIDLLPDLPRLAGVPTAVVGGLRDPARPRVHAETLAAAIPGATLHLFDTGHSCCAELPVAFAAVLRDVAVRAAA